MSGKSGLGRLEWGLGVFRAEREAVKTCLSKSEKGLDTYLHFFH